jgi:hypothetical protein
LRPCEKSERPIGSMKNYVTILALLLFYSFIF